MEKKNNKEINVKELYVVIKKRLWVVILCTILFTALGGIYVSMPNTPLYESATRIYVQANPELFNTLRVLIREPIVLEEVIKDLQLNRSAESLRGQISVDIVDTSTVLRVRVVDRNPALAADIANLVVASYQKVARNRIFFTNIVVLTEAKASPDPQPINSKTDGPLKLGIIAGILLGIGATFILDSLDDTVKSEKEIEQLLGIRVLGKVTKVKRRDIVKKTINKRNPSLRGETIGT